MKSSMHLNGEQFEKKEGRRRRKEGGRREEGGGNKPAVGIEAMSNEPHSKAADASPLKYSSGVENLIPMFFANFL